MNSIIVAYFKNKSSLRESIDSLRNWQFSFLQLNTNIFFQVNPQNFFSAHKWRGVGSFFLMKIFIYVHILKLEISSSTWFWFSKLRFHFSWWKFLHIQITHLIYVQKIQFLLLESSNRSRVKVFWASFSCFVRSKIRIIGPFKRTSFHLNGSIMRISERTKHEKLIQKP